MADHDEGPYVIIERRTGEFGTFLWGLLLGAAAALLFAPKSGRETREELRDSVNRFREEAEDRVREIQRAVNQTVDDVRAQMEEGIDSARRAVETGREQARASRDEVERKLRDTGAAFRAGYDAARSTPGEAGADEDDDDTSSEA